MVFSFGFIGQEYEMVGRHTGKRLLPALQSEVWARINHMLKAYTGPPTPSLYDGALLQWKWATVTRMNIVFNKVIWTTRSPSAKNDSPADDMDASCMTDVRGVKVSIHPAKALPDGIPRSDRQRARKHHAFIDVMHISGDISDRLVFLACYFTSLLSVL